MNVVNTTPFQDRAILTAIKQTFKGKVDKHHIIEIREAECYLNRTHTQGIIDIELYVIDATGEKDEIRIVLSKTDELRWLHHFHTQGDKEMAVEKICSIIRESKNSIVSLCDSETTSDE